MTISREKEEQIRARMTALGLHEEDIEEAFIRGSGPGGQKINKASICVQIRHIPTGLIIRCQETRSQYSNRWLARRELCEKYEARILKKKTEEERERQKIRRQKRRRSRRAKEKMLAEKRATAEKKALRKSVEAGE